MKIILNILLVIAVAIGFIYVKSTVVQLNKELKSLDAEIARAQSELNILKAEYSYLSRPQRVLELAKSRGLEAPSPKEIYEYDYTGKEVAR